MSDHQTFTAAVEEAIGGFAGNLLIGLLINGRVTAEDYAALLQQLFHQTRASSSSFALAGARCPDHRWQVREYLFAHADEEKTHWRWIMDDLGALQRLPKDIESSYPRPPAAAYIAFNFHTAETAPLSRLAIASVLEGIAARYGAQMGARLIGDLGVQPNQLTFFRSHAVTDEGHSEELRALFAGQTLTPDEWRHAAFAAATAGYLYGEIYNDIARLAAGRPN